jgi:hypothetical protein
VHGIYITHLYPSLISPPLLHAAASRCTTNDVAIADSQSAAVRPIPIDISFIPAEAITLGSASSTCATPISTTAISRASTGNAAASTTSGIVTATTDPIITSLITSLGEGLERLKVALDVTASQGGTRVAEKGGMSLDVAGPSRVQDQATIAALRAELAATREELRARQASFAQGLADLRATVKEELFAMGREAQEASAKMVSAVATLQAALESARTGLALSRFAPTEPKTSQ